MPPANVIYHAPPIAAEERERLLRQRGCAVWMTGLSGSGKSSIAYAAEAMLLRRGAWAFVLDGDNVRHGLNSDLGFSPADRTENVRRLGEVAKLFADAGAIVFVSAISPYRADRERARASVGEARFLEVFVDAPLEICEERDPKGLYRRARAGEIASFTGVSAPYERPESPALILETGACGVEESAERLVALLTAEGYLSPS